MATLLIAFPVAIFFGVLYLQKPALTPDLRGLDVFSTIAADVQAIVDTRDLPAAAARIADLESAWDEKEPTLRPINTAEWGAVDAAIDLSLKSLRVAPIDAEKVTAALASLQIVLADPGAAQQAGVAITQIEGIAITDAAGRNLPCEEMLALLRSKLAGLSIPQASDLLVKATERCNADDDLHANTFSAQAQALVVN